MAPFSQELEPPQNPGRFKKTREIFQKGHDGRETAHASRHAFEPQSPMVPYAQYWTKYNRGNAYQFDYAEQRTKWFSGMPGLWVQDAACQSGTSPIYDRTREHLSASDTGIAKTRRLLLERLNALREKGEKPERYDDPDLYMVRSIAVKLPTDASWTEEAGWFMEARLGEGFGYEP